MSGAPSDPPARADNGLSDRGLSGNGLSRIISDLRCEQALTALRYQALIERGVMRADHADQRSNVFAETIRLLEVSHVTEPTIEAEGEDDRDGA